MNAKPHAICDSQGRSLELFVSARQISDDIGMKALPSNLPDVDWLLGDRGCDADRLRKSLKDKGMRSCIPGRKQRKKTVGYDRRRYKRRNRVEIMFGRLTDQSSGKQPPNGFLILLIPGNPIRQMSAGLPLRYRPCGKGLVLDMCSDPSL